MNINLDNKMPLAAWDESLRINIKEIDDQHQRLFKIINSLQRSLRTGECEK